MGVRHARVRSGRPHAARPPRSLTAARAPAASQFAAAPSFNADLSKWDVAKGTDFEYMVRVARPRGGVTSKQRARAAPGAASLAHRRRARPPRRSS